MLFTSSGRCGSVSGLRAGRWFLALPATALGGGSGRSASADGPAGPGQSRAPLGLRGRGWDPRGKEPAGHRARTPSPRLQVGARTSRRRRAGPARRASPGSPFGAHTLCSPRPGLEKADRLSQPEGGSPPPDSNPRCPGDRLPATPAAAQLAQAQAAGARSPPPGTRPQERAAEASGAFPLRKLDAVLPQPGGDPTFPYLLVGESLLLLGRSVFLLLHHSRADPSRRARAEGGGGREERVVFPAAAPGDGPRGGTKREAPGRRAARALWRPFRERSFAVRGRGPAAQSHLPAALAPHQLPAAGSLDGGLVEPSERTRVCRDSVAGRHPSL